MKTKLYLFISLFVGLVFASCNEDNTYFVNENPILNENSVVTGSADVTATTATMHGTITGLENSSSSSYAVGFFYGSDAANLKESITGTLSEGNLTATITDLLDNTTIYYQAFATLQGRLTYRGEVKSLVTTDCTVVTAEAKDVDFAGAKLAGSTTNSPSDAKYGIVIATASENVRAGLIIQSSNPENGAFTIDCYGLAPKTTYYYAAYCDLGSGIVYGDVKDFTTSAYNFDLETGLVDLGLSVKWAKCNLGARSESDYGGLFGYGDVTGVVNTIDVSDYASSDIYRSSNDMANSAWNGSVTLPTAADFEELFTLCSKEWTEVEGVAGYKLTGPNGNSIFLPAAGSRILNSVAGTGDKGAYATGTINPSSNQYAITYSFDANATNRTTTAVYEAISVRPVSTARNAKLDKSLLYGTWEIDYADGASSVFNGPVWFYGTDDSWRTVSNQEPIIGNSWCWDADASNSWAFGDCSGYMTLKEDGTIIVKTQNDEEKTGTYSIDEANKTITASINLLNPSTFPGQVSNLSNEIKILSLGEDRMQLGFFRDSDPCTLSVNLIPQTHKYGMPVTLLCVGSDFNGTWNEQVNKLMPSELEGTHSFKYNGSCDAAKVFTLDFAGLRAAYPNSIVTIKDIRCDGASINFDPEKLFYGDIENNGNFRIEFFNIWGAGSVNGSVDSPFSDTFADNDPAFHFSSSLEMDYAILLEPTFTPSLITINPYWGGTWGYNEGAQFKIVVNDARKLAIENAQFDITYNSTEHADGSIMTFIEVPGLHGCFPRAHASLDALYLDGNEVNNFDASKVVDTSEDAKYRLELWNMYGATSQSGCAFGTPAENGAIQTLGFSSSMRLKFTFQSLF